eukprot:XP_014769408.1 PREDICTED: anionic trypsin-2-like [Octopus bimaculoides]
MYKSLGLIILAVVACLYAIPIKNVNEHIVSGTESQYCEFPHMVFLNVSLVDGGGICGGTLISDKHVLTAAHCVPEGVAAITAHIGSTNKKTAVVRTPVKKWVKHRDYIRKQGTVDNDIAVLELTTPVPISACIKPVDLPNKGDKFHKRCITAGWGKTGKHGIFPNQMRRTNIDIIPNDKCQSYSPGTTVEQHICVGALLRNGTNICYGDSGGGLLCTTTVDYKYVVAGVASYGYDCDEGFAVFTNTANYRDFIDENITE